MIDTQAAARAALDRLSRPRPAVRLAVVGDVMLDRFLYGTVDRISPEAPVPVVTVAEETYRLGAAANVVHNLRSLGAEVDLVGVVGSDAAAKRVRGALRKLGVGGTGLLAARGRPTAVKTRVIAQHQQVVRFDREPAAPLDEATAAALLERLEGVVPSVQAVIVSDYGKGVVSDGLMRRLMAVAGSSGIRVAVDPKPANMVHYRGVDVVTPNVREAEAMSGVNAATDAQAEEVGRRILKKLQCRAVLLTRGERGMSLIRRGHDGVHVAARARDVFDVTGAGDTAVAVLTLALASGASPVEAACLANLAAGIVVGKLGTGVVTMEELRDAASLAPPGSADR